MTLAAVLVVVVVELVVLIAIGRRFAVKAYREGVMDGYIAGAQFALRQPPCTWETLKRATDRLKRKQEDKPLRIWGFTVKRDAADVDPMDR